MVSQEKERLSGNGPAGMVKSITPQLKPGPESTSLSSGLLAGMIKGMTARSTGEQSIYIDNIHLIR
jgi:hypothetical protein